MEIKEKYIFDLHIHTARYSFCSNLSPEDLIKSAKERELDGIVITEHGMPWPPDELSVLNELSGEDGPLVLTGQEVRVTGSDGREADVLVYGMRKSVEEYIPVNELLNIVESEGAVAVAAHPRRNILGLQDDIYHYRFHAIEALNSNYGTKEITMSINDMKNLDCAFTGGSDAHSVKRIGRYVTVFPHPVHSIDDIVKAIKKKECFPAAGFITEDETGKLLEENNMKIINNRRIAL